MFSSIAYINSVFADAFSMCCHIFQIRIGLGLSFMEVLGIYNKSHMWYKK